MMSFLVALLLVAQVQAPAHEPAPAAPQDHAAPQEHAAPQGHEAQPSHAAPDHGGRSESTTFEHLTSGGEEHHGPNSGACQKASALEKCRNPSLCAAHDETVAGHVFHHVSDEVYKPICVDLGQGKVFDLSISKHVIWMWVAAGLLILAFGYATARRSIVPKGFYSLLESFVLFVRDEIAVKNIGEHHAHHYVGYLCTAFFFILFMNLVGLLPWGASATGNLSVTVVLALCTFVVTQVAGMRGQGVVGYWMHLVPAGVPKWLYPIMVPVEILGLFTKPFALTVRLFANMVAGHIVILFLLALTVILSVYVAPVSVLFALGIFMLELFVALVQAYVFTMLSALFIGMASHAH
jgi:F-type H+-transporting ATPase subunit a